MRERAREILALSKMNWNSAEGISRHPITLSFAKKVGTIMTEMGDDSELRTHHIASTCERRSLLRGNAFPLAGAYIAGAPPSAGDSPATPPCRRLHILTDADTLIRHRMMGVMAAGNALLIRKVWAAAQPVMIPRRPKYDASLLSWDLHARHQLSSFTNLSTL